MNDEQNIYDALSNLGSSAWINQYYNLIKKLFSDLAIEGNDPRFSMTCTQDQKLHLILGSRYVLRPIENERIRCTVPYNLKLTIKNADDHVWGFTRENIKGIEIPFPLGKEIPPEIYSATLHCSKEILRNTNKSNFRHKHVPLLYSFTIDEKVRLQVLSFLKKPIIESKRIDFENTQENKSYLLTWNPSTWTWNDYKEMQKKIQKYGGVVISWSCGNTKSIQPGDTVYLIRVGQNAPGIIGKGISESKPYIDRHFKDIDREANYIRIKLNVLADKNKPIISLDTLKNKIPNQLWTPQASGTSIKGDSLIWLEKLWYEECSKGSTVYNLLHDSEYPETSSLEGGKYSVWQTKYERDPEARRRCLALKGYKCVICMFDFFKTYGELGKEFIHVHHIIQLSSRSGSCPTDPGKDLIPVCPNCHAMLHRGRKMPMPPEELIDIICKNEKNG
jgi:5-methylcytosine-specific restriction protein A